MFLEKILAGILSVNCYVVGDDKSGKAAVIDPGGDADKIMKVLKDNGFELAYIILTHAHGDHIGGVAELQAMTKAPLYVHKKDLYILQNKNINYSAHMAMPEVELTTDNLLKDGDILPLGNASLRIIHTPGHSPGGICILVDKLLFTGDTLFSNSIGRTDLEGGDHNQLVKAIKKRLFVLDDDILVLPGHGPASRIGIEKLTNRYIR